MRVLVQRSKEAYVLIEGKTVGKIERGLVLLVGFTNNDSIKEIDYMVDKIINLRIFDDENNVMNKSLLDIGGSVLSISQFTLYADTKKGRRPSYINSLNSNDARVLYELFNKKLKEKNIDVQTGIFQADMQVHLINDGPVTIMLEKEGEE